MCSFPTWPLKGLVLIFVLCNWCLIKCMLNEKKIYCKKIQTCAANRHSIESYWTMTFYHFGWLDSHLWTLFIWSHSHILWINNKLIRVHNFPFYDLVTGMVHLSCQLDEIWNHLGKGPLGMPVGYLDYANWDNWGGETASLWAGPFPGFYTLVCIETRLGAERKHSWRLDCERAAVSYSCHCGLPVSKGL